jgi:hypothetical protein
VTVVTHLLRGRARHQLLMLDTVTIVRPDPTARAYDPVTQTYGAASTAVYTGPCRVVTWRGNEEDAAETEVAVIRYRLDLPLTASAPIVRRRDVATVTASFNPVLVGLVLTITEPEYGTTATALRLVGEVAL